jgi:outer membrane protein assembly factor BamB
LFYKTLGEKNLKTSKNFVTNKTKAATITLVLALTIPAILATLPIVGAHDPPWEVPTWCYISVTNNPIGVGQTTYLFFWLNHFPRTAIGAYGDRWTFTVEVTKPDGSIETLGPFTSDPVGTGFAPYTPAQLGTYNFVAIFHEHTLTGEPFPPGTSGLYFGTPYVNDTYLASTSDPFQLTVQEDPIEAWEEPPLPTEYWERPINTMNREWDVLAANWLAGAAQNVGPTSNFNYGTGPESAHIMWATPFWAGGIMDKRFGDIGYQTAHYSGLSFEPPIILNGKIYYNVGSHPREGWYCLDLYTGEELYFHNTTGPVTGVLGTQEMSGPAFDPEGSISGESLAFGQIYNYDSPNQHGGFPYLWSTSHPTEPNTWMMFDAYSGSYICSIENVPSWASSALVYGKEGSILAYNLDTTNNLLQCWNTSRAIWYREQWNTNQYWMWRPYLNYTFGGIYGYSLNVSIPDVQGSMLAVREGQFVIGGTSGKHNDTYVEQGNLWALSLKPGEEGTLLWNKTFTPPLGVPDTAECLFGAGIMTGPTVDPEDGVFLFSQSITRERWGFSLDTMEMLWGPTEPEASMNYYGMEENIYDGKLFSYGYSGELIAYNITTGEKLWTYTAKQEGFESPYGNYPIGIACIADGKIYLTSSEHSPTQPLWRGSYLRCIDANTGTELWKINNWGLGSGSGASTVIADGYIVSLNAYDNRIYCYGKGPSATTVTGPETSVPLGEEVLIQGTVTDLSAGTKQGEQAARFPNGVPAVADEYMSEWMEYLYMQQSCPESYTGVPVKLEAFGEDGSYIDIGWITSDPYGNFKYTWAPSDEGLYTIMATFEGSDSYWGSYDATGLSVGSAPEPSGPIEPEEPAEAPLITTEVAIIVAAVIVAVAVIVGFWIVRKRK